MKLLLLGSGGREHALAWKIAQSPKIEKLYIAPGNAGTSEVGENVAIKADDFAAIKEFVVKNDINMVVVGPEDPLVKGIYDYFKNDEALKTYLLSVRQRQVPYWKEAKNLQKDSCSVITFRLPVIRALLPLIWKKVWHFSKHWKLRMY